MLPTANCTIEEEHVEQESKVVTHNHTATNSCPMAADNTVEVVAALASGIAIGALLIILFSRTPYSDAS